MEGDIFLRTNMIWNYILGVRNTNFKNPLWNKLHKLYAYFWLSSGLLLIASLFYQFGYMKHADPQVITENLRITFLITFSVVKYFRMQTVLSEHMVNHIRRKETDILACGDPIIIDIYQRQLKMNHRICQFFMVFGYATLFCFQSHPVMYEYLNPPDAKFDIIDNVTVYRPRPLPFGGEFPFDKYKYYGWAYGFHAWTGMFCCGGTLTPDIFFWALMIFGVTEIRILQYKLRNFKKLALKEAIAGLDEDELIMKYLRECIIEHKLIIKYIGDLDDLIRDLMLVDSGLASIQMAVIGFGLIMLGFGVTAFVAFEYLLWTMSQLFFFYWFANEIMLASWELQDSIWESDWCDCNLKVKKMIVFILMRLQKPMALYVGPFYQMSVETMLAILKTGFSYFALMRQMYT